jgi:hypothetical protein
MIMSVIDSIRETVYGKKPLKYGKDIGTISFVHEAGKGITFGSEQSYIPQMLGKTGPGRPKGDLVEPKKDFDKYLAAYTGVPIVAAAIDRTVDFVVSPGFYIVSDDKKAKKAVEDFIKKMDFDIFLRNVVKNMLIYGDSFVEIVGNKTIKELKVLNPVQMRVKRTRTGTVQGYVQDVGWSEKNPSWSPNQIAHFIYNKLGSSAYGTSMIEPLLPILKSKVKMEQAMEQIMKRKASAPIHVKMGSDEFPATQDDINSMAGDLSGMTNKTEWVTGHTVEMDVVGFRSKIIDVDPFTTHFDNQMVYGLQVPYVLLGLGNIAEGLARVQLEAMDRRSKSIQMLVEHQLETKIFSKLLGTEEKVVEFEWGTPSLETEQLEIQKLLSVLQSPVSPEFKAELETQLRRILNVEGRGDEKHYEEQKESESEDDEGPYQKYLKTKGQKEKEKGMRK